MAGSYHQLGIVAGAPRAAGRGRGLVPQVPRHQGRTRRPPRHGAHLPPARHSRPGRGRLDEAEDWYREALAINEELGDRPGVALATTSSADHPGPRAAGRGRGLVPQSPGHQRRTRQPAGHGGYHQLGTVARARGRLEEAEDWYRKSLAINEELGDLPGMAISYDELGLLAEDRGQPREALAWMIRCVTLFGEFPHPLTDAQRHTWPG